ncbi:hypothetical protein [Bradyrhizobium elkanii]
MSFYLVRLEPDGNGAMIDVPLPDYGPYEKGGEAAKMAKQLSDQRGYKVQPRRSHQAPDWRERQAKRLADGSITALPAAWDLPAITDHFAHLANSDNTKIAFTESEDLGIIDRVTIVTPGRYLTRFYPEVDDDRRRKLIAAIDPNSEIKYATTQDEITWVYKEGPESCMDNRKARGFDQYPVWPTAVYAAGDLVIAYQLNERNRIQSRCLCWPEKKLFGRVFGDFQRMKAAMEAEGYTYIREDNKVEGNLQVGQFEGARILKVELSNDKGSYVLPYFDDIYCVLDKGDHFVTARALPEPGPDVRYAASGGTDGTSVLMRWCPKARSFEMDCGFAYVHHEDEYWSRAARNTHAFTCSATGQEWPVEHREYVTVEGRVQSWNPVHFHLHGETCQHSGDSFPRDEIVTLSNGMRVHKLYCAHVDGEDVLCDGGKAFETPDFSWHKPVEAFPEFTVRSDDFIDAMSLALTSSTVTVTNQVVIEPEAANTNEQIDPAYLDRFNRMIQQEIERSLLTGDTRLVNTRAA